MDECCLSFFGGERKTREKSTVWRERKKEREIDTLASRHRQTVKPIDRHRYTPDWWSSTKSETENKEICLHDGSRSIDGWMDASLKKGWGTLSIELLGGRRYCGGGDEPREIYNTEETRRDDDHMRWVSIEVQVIICRGGRSFLSFCPMYRYEYWMYAYVWMYVCIYIYMCVRLLDWLIGRSDWSSEASQRSWLHSEISSWLLNSSGSTRKSTVWRAKTKNCYCQVNNNKSQKDREI